VPLTVELRNASPELRIAIETIDHQISHLDALADAEVRTTFLSVVYKTLLFLEHRLNASPAQDPATKYLFKPDALEHELQEDYFRFMKNCSLGSTDEERGIGGGRADVAFKIGNLKIVTEVKRETSDASFEVLVTKYSEQTAMYQTTNLRAGILLVLDLAPRESLLPHISTLYKAFVRDIMRDGTKRGIVVIRVPGNRVSPSEATRTAKSRKRSKLAVLSE
jgi:hypothetical protein